MIKTNTPNLPQHNAGSIASSIAGIAVSLLFSGGLWVIMR